MTDESPTVTIPATATTPAVSLSGDEHQLLADLKARGHDLTILFKDAIAKL